jgi:alkanesulfonate monooxygenase SsuD/methylene tetrahydromethanopterin reductase-like flavin-dependent oxidoreductase (luciferase family)
MIFPPPSHKLGVDRDERRRETIRMQLGFFTMPIHPVDKDWRVSLREDREAFILADKLGFVEGYVGEHTTDRAENITSCVTFIATLVDATKRIRLGTGTINMPNAHPAAVAANIAMLDHLLDGRFIFGISPGGLLSDAEVFGNLDANRNEMFVEAIDQVLAIWAGEPPYNIKGKYWSISTERTLMRDIGQGFLPKPLQKPHPPIVVTVVAPYSKGVTEAAARGWEPISANFLLPQWVKSHWPKYVEGCHKAGRLADPANWRIAKSIFVADSDKKARDYVMSANSPYRNYYHSLVTKIVKAGRGVAFKETPDVPDSAVTVDSVVDKLVIYGSPNKVAEKLLEFREQVGEFGTLLYPGKDWLDYDLGRRSMVLLAEKVMPKVNTALSKAGRTAAE